MSSLTLEDLAEAKGLPEELLVALGCRTESLAGVPYVAIPYYDEGGQVVATRRRHALDVDEDGHDRRFSWPPGTRVAHLYGVECLAEVRATAAPLLLGEGESDRWTAAHYGLYFIGVPGKSLWAGERGRRWAGQLAGLDVFIWQEPGAEDFTARIAADLPGARLIVASEGIKDLSEAHLQGHDVPDAPERAEGGSAFGSRQAPLTARGRTDSGPWWRFIGAGLAHDRRAPRLSGRSCAGSRLASASGPPVRSSMPSVGPPLATRRSGSLRSATSRHPPSASGQRYRRHRPSKTRPALPVRTSRPCFATRNHGRTR